MSDNEEFYKLFESIMNLDPKVRFVSIIDSQGQVVCGGQRQGIENYLSELDQKLSIKHALDAWRIRTQFSDQIGESKFAMAEYGKIKRYTIPLDQNHLLYMTTDTEIDHCAFTENVLRLKDSAMEETS